MLAGAAPLTARAQAGAEEPAKTQAPPKTRARTPVPAKPAESEKASKDRASGKDRPSDRDKASAKDAASGKDKGDSSSAKGSTSAKDKTTDKDPTKGAGGAPPGIQASPVGRFGQWSVFAAGQGKERICYAISRPQQRTPKTIARDTGYLFVTVRKPKLDDEIALIMGFPVGAPGKAKPASAGRDKAGTKTASLAQPANASSQIVIGTSKFALIGKEKNAWVQDQADEPKLVREMGKFPKMTVTVLSAKAEEVTDEYSLGGFSEALKRTHQECK